ncbi:MAG: HAD-IC family P-type ATPase [Microthrixaceae bacterium]
MPDPSVSHTASVRGDDGRAPDHPSVTTDPAVGLTAAEVAARTAAGLVNDVPSAPTRTLWQIVRANVFTPVNAVIGVLFVAILIARGGPSADMAFAGVIVANSVIGTVQELRARAALDRLAVLEEPSAVVVRDGTESEIPVEEVVVDDLLVLRSGAQVIVDGVVAESVGLDLDESMLTGESDPVTKADGDEVLSGSFVVAGHGRYQATRIGAESYAASLAEEAKRFSLVDSELRSGVNRILRVLMLLIPPVAALLMWRLLGSTETWQEALTGVVAAAVAMVPDGLVLLTSLAFMAGVIKLARKDALLRELASVELLARVDTLCLDKTGTITTGDIHMVDLEVLGRTDDAQASRMLGAIVCSTDDPNPTLAAIAARHHDNPGWKGTGAVPFSSARKWSAAGFTTDEGPLAVYLGAPEYLAPDDAHVAAIVGRRALLGQRVVLVATAAELAGEVLPGDLVPAAVVALEDEIRSDAQEILGYFVGQGIDLKVISGDHPDTVAAVARRAGVPGADHGVDARTLPDDPERLGEALESTVVMGRVTPQQKQAMVTAQQGRGHVVAMTGDGVNDVLALKDADMGIAMGAGSAASRAVAQMVLLDNRFSVLPVALAEGRRVINSVERAANLFVYGTVYSVIISLVIAIVGTDFPFLPRHLTLVRTLSVGIPGFFLALAPDPRRARPGFLDRVVRFSIPAGAIAAAAALTVYLAGRADSATSLTEARSAATITLLGVGFAILLRLTRSLPPWRWVLVGAMAAAIMAVLAIPALAKVFDLDMPPGGTWVAIGVVVALAAAALQFVRVTADGGDVATVPPPPDA